VQRYSERRAGDVIRIEVPYRGGSLLRHPLYNKGTAFTRAERETFGLEGLLPHAVSTLDQQVRRMYASIVRKADPLEQYIGLAALQERNETLFHRLLLDNIEEFMPIVYTPTVGLACQEYSRIFRRGRGIWITPGHRGRIEGVLRSAPFEDVRLIVATDNERILGLGDQGAGGMGIPIGKLALYTAVAGIHPAQTLPVSLDVGTDNAALLADDLYIGWRQPRLRGADYDSLLDEFVRAVKAVFPRALLQWEDFKKPNAVRLLHAYRRELPSFNDDIQGTAAMALGTIQAAERITHTPLARERIVIVGGGAAGIGIAHLAREAMKEAGVQGDDLFRAIAVVDRAGLLVDDVPIADPDQRAFAWPAPLASTAGIGAAKARQLEAVVRALRPTVLVGATGQAGTFTREAVEAMAAQTRRPVILPLSNPTSCSEATPDDLMAWTDGRALVATGSPFPEVKLGRRRRRSIAQANNAFIFPAIGLASVVGQVPEVTVGMFRAAAAALAKEVTEDELRAGRLLPRVRDLRPVTARLAAAILREVRASGVNLPFAERDTEAAILAAMWEPRYAELVPVDHRETSHPARGSAPAKRGRPA
jgi:malate dehydrogenase (oxaloacetate-decarboxylating)